MMERLTKQKAGKEKENELMGQISADQAERTGSAEHITISTGSTNRACLVICLAEKKQSRGRYLCIIASAGQIIRIRTI
jgi:uncharacterized SAM-dependent methyltransferase